MGNKIRVLLTSLISTLIILVILTNLFELYLGRSTIGNILQAVLGILIWASLYFFFLNSVEKEGMKVLKYYLFISSMPLVLLLIFIVTDTNCLDSVGIHFLMEIFGWEFYEGETRSRYLTILFTGVLLPILTLVVGLSSYLFFRKIKKNKRQDF